MRRVWSFLQRHPAVRFGRYEWSLYRDLVRWARGRVLIPDEATPLPHPPGRLQMLGFLTAIMLVELVVVHLLLPAGAWRVVALLVSIWGIVFIWALIASERVRPSYVSETELALRRGRRVFAVIPRASIALVQRDRTFASEVAIGNSELVLGGPAGTDTLVELARPVDAAHDGYPWQKTRTEPVTRVRLHAGGQLAV